MGRRTIGEDRRLPGLAPAGRCGATPTGLRGFRAHRISHFAPSGNSGANGESGGIPCRVARLGMELLEAILQRRTIKDFKPDVVPSDVLDRALTAGLWAQNHRLTEPWRFTILGPETHAQLAESFAQAQAAQSSADAAGKVQADARGKILSKPCVVAVSQRLGGPAAQQREDYAAVACAIQNIQLAAWAEGVGMQWSSGKIIQLPAAYARLGIDPAREEIVGLLFFGYPGERPGGAASPAADGGVEAAALIGRRDKRAALNCRRN